MKILVLVKPVPDPEKYNEIRTDESGCIIREGVPTIVNPTDRNALEAALEIREAKAAEGESAGEGDCTVSVLTMAPEFSRDKITECLAMGADEGYMLSDIAFAGADTYATSYVLAEAIKRLESECGQFDLILAGNESADGATSHVPVQVAAWLGITHISRVCSLKMEGETIRATKRSEDVMLTFEGEDPAVIAVTRDINRPRLISAIGIVKARKKPLTVWTLEDIEGCGFDRGRIGLEGSPTKTGRLFMPDRSRKAQPLCDNPDAGPEEAAKAILAILGKAGV